LENSKLVKQIQDLTQITASRYEELQDIGVLAGRSGIALFQFYAAKHFDDDRYAETGEQIILSCVDKINDGYSIAGFGWTLQHLLDNGFIELDVDELLSPFDDYLRWQMQLNLQNGFYDFLHGAMGYGFYFLKRLSSYTTKKTARSTYIEYLKFLVQELERLAIEDKNGLKWESVLNIEKGNRGFNLSFSHGMSSIVYLLSKIYQEGIAKEGTASLIEGAVGYLRSLRILEKKEISLYPSWVEEGAALSYESRLAWCYGDLGIAMAFENAAEVLKSKELANSAMEILSDTNKRREPETSMVVDAGFCHGSFGNAHIFNKYGLKYGKPEFDSAARFWMEDGLRRHTGITKEPFKQWSPPDKSWRFELTLLEGISGIGLTMIDYLSKEENTWDQCLMLC